VVIDMQGTRRPYEVHELMVRQNAFTRICMTRQLGGGTWQKDHSKVGDVSLTRVRRGSADFRA